MASQPDHGIRVVDSTGPLAQGFVDKATRSPAFLDVSVRNRYANPWFLRRVVPWLSERSDDVRIVIGGDLLRYNYMVLRGMPPDRAAEKAAAIGRKPMKAVKAIIEENGFSARVKVHSTREVTEEPGFHDVLRRVKRLKAEDHAFSEDLRRETEAFAQRAQAVLEFTGAVDLDRLEGYLVEETAILLHLHRTGYAVEVYAGPDLEFVRKAAAGDYAGSPFCIPERSHISVAAVEDIAPA